MDLLAKAVEILKKGDLVAAPTETVYGLFGDACNDSAVQKIYEVKGRPSINPLILHVCSLEMAEQYCNIFDATRMLIQKFWEKLKAPITFIVPLREDAGISPFVTAGLKTVAIRKPNNDFALKMIEGVGRPLAAPSANTSSMVSPTSFEMVMQDIGSKIPLVVDGGSTKIGLESTILDITKRPYVILRQGGLSQEIIESLCTIPVVENKEETCIKAPGMLKKHYAPSLPLRINVLTPSKGEAFITFGSEGKADSLNLSPKGDLKEAAHNLFAFIKQCDDPKKFTGIAVMPIPPVGLGKAINDRIKRAASVFLRKKVLLIILDGFGYSMKIKNNATVEAEYIWSLKKKYPYSFLFASGKYVGLPDDQVGNSEVGHLTIGSGRVNKQKLPLISEAIAEGKIANNPDLLNTLKKVKICHLMGLFSSGGVHSHLSHFSHCLEILRNNHVDVRIHLFLDGRDVGPSDALDTLKKAFVEDWIREDEIATVHGRYYAMDRDNKMDRTELSFKAIKDGEAEFKDVIDPLIMIKDFYDKGIYDETIPPFVMKGYKGMSAGDTVWMVNYRTDRIKQILKLFHSANFPIIEMVEVDPKIDADSLILFPSQKIVNTLGEVVSKYGLKQLRIAETEKYAHVTYFLNGGEDKQYPGEDRCLIDSPRVKDYAESPDMSAKPLTDKLVEFIRQDKYDLIIANYATPDMLGHTGNFEKTKEGIRKLDAHIKRVIEKALANGYDLIITADHGNAEKMQEENGMECKTHTNNRVPIFFISKNPEYKVMADHSLTNIAPTILQLLNLPCPPEMDGRFPLLKKIID